MNLVKTKLSLICLLVLSNFVLSTPSKALSCKATFEALGFLRTGTSFKLADWQEILDVARTEGEVDKGALALVNIGLLKASEAGLTKREIQALKVYRNILEKPEIIRLFPDSQSVASDTLSSRQVLGRLAALTGINDLARARDTLGRPRGIVKRLGSAIGRTTKDLAWGHTPFIFRMVPAFRAHLLAERTDFKAIVNKLENAGVSRDPFIESIVDRHFSDGKLNGTRAMLRKEGDFIRVLLLTGLLSVFGSHPIDLASDALNESYDFEDMEEDIEEEIGIRLAGSDIGFIADKDLMGKGAGIAGKVLDMEFDPLKIQFVEDLKKNSLQFDGTKVSSIEELNDALGRYRNKDNVCVLAHGAPGDFLIGGESVKKNLHKIDASKLKDGANLIFISCNFGDNKWGDSNPKSQTWVKMADKKLQNGTAVASVTPVPVTATITKFDNGNDEDKAKFFGLVLLGTFTNGFQKATTGPIPLFTNDVPKAFFSPYGSKPGFLAYDSQSGKIEYYRHSEKPKKQ